MNPKNYYTEGAVLLLIGLIFSYIIKHFEWDKGLYILSFGIAFYGALQVVAALRYSRGKVDGMVEIIYDLQNMPATMKRLALVTLFTWFALFAMFIYTTSAVTSYHYGTTIQNPPYIMTAPIGSACSGQCGTPWRRLSRSCFRFLHEKSAGFRRMSSVCSSAGWG